MTIEGSPTQEASGEEYSAFDAWALVHRLREKLWLVVLCAIGGLLLGVAYFVFAPDAYEATAIVQVEQQNPTVVALQDVTKEDFRQPEDLKTVEQLLSTDSLVWRVIQRNKLDQLPGYFKPGFFQKLRGEPVTRTRMIAALSDTLTVKLRRGTRLIDIAVAQTDPTLAQTIARSLIEEYGNESDEGRANPSKLANKFLVDEAERLKHKVETSEHALQDYRENNQAVSLEDKQNIVVERLKDLNLRMAKAQNERVALEADLAQIEKIGRDPEKLLAIGTIANAQSVLDVKRVFTEKEAAFAMLKQRYGSQNPAYVQAEQELQQIRASLQKVLVNAADSLRSTYEAAKITEETSERMLREQERAALDLNRKAIQYDVLSREVDSDRTLFASVVKRLKETSLMEDISQANLRVVQAPMLPDKPGLRKKLLVMMLATLGCLMIGCASVVGAYIIRPSFQTLPDAERVLGLPALGAIPRVRGLKTAAETLPGIAAPQSQAAEAFRFVTSSVSVLSGATDHRNILFASATRQDGNSVCAASYAIALAQQGMQTLLIGADLRCPALAQMFSLPATAGGLSECLAGRSRLESAVMPSKIENLFILPAGDTSATPARLLSGPAIGELLKEAGTRFQRVVIDSAPINEASETLLLASHVHAACLVIRASYTPISAVIRACQLLDMAGRLPLGFVLNRVSRPSLA